MKLWPFFCYYGGKWRAAPRYPKPQHDTIIEPFAGAAGYALRHHERQIVLVEKNKTLTSLWRYLIAATPDSIRKLPLIADDGSQTVDDLKLTPDEAALVGFWLNKSTVSPSKSPSAWMRNRVRPKSFWGPEIRERIARQVDAIRHWRVLEGDYTAAPDIEATWYIDPPYAIAGSFYKESNVDYAALAAWCRCRRGQVMVCENVGAKWLPFQPHIIIKSTQGKHGKGKSHEALWTPMMDLL
jgi:site-specific DNA-adenine methylase